MSGENRPTDRSDDATARAIRLLAERGYEATSVGELADAAGMSRSTFFRRFGSKEDVVFADHAFLLSRVSERLAADAGDPLEAVCDGARFVLEHLVARAEVARIRYRLLQQNPALRDRELVTSSRYEAAFTAHLRAAGSAPAADAMVVAFAAAVVAVHNLALRSWLRGDEPAPVALLAREAATLTAAFRPLLALHVPDAPPTAPSASRRVIVAVVDPGTTPAAVLADIARTLES